MNPLLDMKHAAQATKSSFRSAHMFEEIGAAAAL